MMLYCICLIAMINLIGFSDTYGLIVNDSLIESIATVNANANIKYITTDDLLFGDKNNDTCVTHIEYININNTNETITLRKESIISKYIFKYGITIESELLIGSNQFSINLCFSKIYPIELCVVYLYPNNNYTQNINNFEIYYTTEDDDVNASLTKGELYISASNCQGFYDDCSNIVFDSSVTNDDCYFIKELKFIGNIDDSSNNNNDDEMLFNMQCYYNISQPPASSPTLPPTLSPTSLPTKSSSKSTVSTGAIVGIVVGAAVIVCVIVVLL